MSELKPEQRIHVAIVVAFVVVCLVIYVLQPDFFAQMWRVVISGDVEATIAYLRSFGAWALLFSFIVNVLINALGFLPSIFISTANGVVFGIGLGIGISWLAEVTGVIISFILMRGILRQSAEHLIAKSAYLQKIDEFSGQNGFKLMLVARSMPYFPSGIITAVGALSKMSFRDYCFATLIGKFPSTALEVIIGHDVVNYEKNMGRLAVVVLVAVVIYGVLWYRSRTPQPTEGERRQDGDS